MLTAPVRQGSVHACCCTLNCCCSLELATGCILCAHSHNTQHPPCAQWHLAHHHAACHEDATCLRCHPTIKPFLSPTNTVWLDAGYPETQVHLAGSIRLGAATCCVVLITVPFLEAYLDACL